MSSRYVTPASNCARVTLWQAEKSIFFAPVSLQMVSAMSSFESSMWKTTGIPSAFTLSIRKVTVAAEGSASSAHPGQAA